MTSKAVGAVTPGEDPRVLYVELSWNASEHATVVVFQHGLSEFVFCGRALSASVAEGRPDSTSSSS